ncbi:MAG: hypothetical protein KIT31_07915 [Deltaproteobacteria bacterium]|nr:hypothetical protein [Deltaproteobacteria bacterium]
MHVRCSHTKANRIQECILVMAEERVACLPVAPPANAVGKLAAGLAMTAAGIVELRVGARVLGPGDLRTAEDLAAAVDASGGFYLGADWTYRTRVPVIGTMIMRAGETLTTREHVPPELLAQLTPNRAPPSAKAVVVACAIGAAIVAAGVIAGAATGSLEILFGVGCWGLLIAGAALFAWLRLRRM